LHSLVHRKLDASDSVFPNKPSIQQGRFWFNAYPLLELSSFVSTFPQIREKIVGIFSSILGDTLSAEYFLFSLLSRIHKRQGTLTLGKFSLNLSNVNEEAGKTLTTVLSQFSSEILPQHATIHLSLETLNKGDFIPKKNYDKNMLEPGLLQLADGKKI
jgi:hypothetical protein